MCGITGIFAFNLVGKFNKINITAATGSLEKRGPDFQDIYLDEWVALGHRRLSIIDTTNAGNQPMWDSTLRYCIVYNGEIFNFPELRKELITSGISFQSHSDTEVLLQLFIRDSEKCLTKLNGFFSFCIYDKQEQTFFVARDRYGIKPLLYVFDEDKFIFGSEMKAIQQYGVEKTLNYNALFTYLQLNYIPAPDSIFANVHKLLPGHYLRVSRQHIEQHAYYEIPYERQHIDSATSYDKAKEKIVELLASSVEKRLIADVPIGAFLSGGIDSSVITALATRYKPDLHTFSIGFRDEKFFDETAYAQMVSKKFNTQHTTFSLSNSDLYKHLHVILEYTDEPFGDSSAIAVYILSKETRKHATVALSGDGADELFSGYNKHSALHRSLTPGVKEQVVSKLGSLWKMLPQSRNGKMGNTVRQLNRFAEGMSLPLKERYWQWAGYAKEDEAMQLLSDSTRDRIDQLKYTAHKDAILKHLHNDSDLNAVLLTDMNLVLPNDMLTKVDLMSMANGLEVRTPFLDYRLVDFVFSLPVKYKINSSMRKRILQDAFRDVLPSQLYNRPKKGFEVPLLKWFRGGLRSLIEDDLLSNDFILAQGIFNVDEIAKLKQRLYSSNPGDIHARIWGLIVFQHWWKRNF